MPMPPESDNIPSNFEPIKIGKEPPRERETIWLCTDPDGVVHEVAQRNIRDWERRGAGWSVQGKKEKAAKVKAAPVEAVEAVEAVEPTATLPLTPEVEMVAAPDVLTPLNDLRARAAALGIDVKQNWGMKRLTKEIEAASTE